MKPIPSDILTRFEAVLKKRAVSADRHADYKKWLMYYLDFKSKYSLPDSRSEHVRLFIEKLKKKNQSPEQQKQAAHAVSLFFESEKQKRLPISSQYMTTSEGLTGLRGWGSGLAITLLITLFIGLAMNQYNAIYIALQDLTPVCGSNYVKSHSPIFFKRALISTGSISSLYAFA